MQGLSIGTHLLSKKMKVEHRGIRRLVENHKADFEELGSIVDVKNTEGSTSALGGRPIHEYILNEDQVFFLILLLPNGSSVSAAKRQMIIDFSSIKKETISAFCMRLKNG